MVAGLHSFAKIRSAPAERIFCPTFEPDVAPSSFAGHFAVSDTSG